MAFHGYFIKIGDYKFPTQLILEESYKIKPNQRQNKNAYTNANGKTVTNPLKHTKTNIKFTTVSMSGKTMRKLLSNIAENYTNYDGREMICTYYDVENSFDDSKSYKTGEFYMSQSLEFTINRLLQDMSDIQTYGEMQWEFTEK